MKKRLFKVILIASFLFITFFSVNVSTYAASFAYADFKWEEFADQNKNLWTSACKKDDEDCIDSILANQKKFYVQLYKLLAKYERKGYKIDDNIIIATVYFGLSPNDFADPEFNTGAYNVDDVGDTALKFLGDDEGNINSAKTYFEKETDTIKTLLNNMIGYSQICYGISDETPQTNSSGEKYCNNNLVVSGNQCVAKLKTMKSSFFNTIGLSVSIDNIEDCRKLSEGYSSFHLNSVSSEKEVNEEFYWNFLIDEPYFDKKEHLQIYFRTVIGESKYDNMKDILADRYEYKLLEDDIKAARTKIVNNIRSVLDSYGDFSVTPNSSFHKVERNNYWWPIGSVEVTLTDGISTAIGEPESITILNNYGLYTDPNTGNSKMNNGIDIQGVSGVTNVIAARDGIVIKVASDCVAGDSSCESGYGNHVLIQHLDNNYTLYAHLDTNSIKVNFGDSVKSGQVIGKVGNTGDTDGSYLHFEVRVGGDNSSSSQNPFSFISAENPRAIGVEDNLMEWIGVLEGTGKINGDNYVVYKDSGGIATFGHGITVIHNTNLIKSFGIDPDSLIEGSYVNKAVADEMYEIIMQRRIDSIKTQLSSKGLSFNEYQIGALLSLQYNTGNIYDFFPNYELYGNTESLCNDWWNKFKLRDANGNYLEGLVKRRKAECNAFVNNVYNMNPYG